MKEFNEIVLKAAMQYINKGWAVFPVHSMDNGKCTCGKDNCSDAGKHPRVPRGLKEASTDIEKIKKWFGEGAPKSNIAIVTGSTSGITVIDIDIGKGKLGAESWQSAIDGHGEPQTLMSTTGSGGKHVVFQYNSAVKTSTNAIGDAIDIRNDGGYIVAPPSLHRSGGKYEWDEPQDNVIALPAYLVPVKADKRKKGNKKIKYSIEMMEEILDHVPSDDRETWRNVGLILGREYSKSDSAWELYQNWSEKANVAKGRNHDQIMKDAFYNISQQKTTGKELSAGTIIQIATENGWAPDDGEVPKENFVFFAYGNNYLYTPAHNYWVAAAVDAAVSPVNDAGTIVKASMYIRKNKLATSITCEPNIEESYIKGFDCKEGELTPCSGGAVYNMYNKSSIELGDAALAKPFVEHVHKVFNKEGDAKQFLDYMAHRVQKPGDKPRFAILIAGGQGVGKDTAIEFCVPAIGVFNVSNISPQDFESGFNEYAATTLVRVSEAANLKDMSKWALNEQMKVLIAGSPDYCKINPKYGVKYSVRMFCGVIITTNHLIGGIHIPEDDRRYDVIECATAKQMGLEKYEDKNAYFEQLWEWFKDGGDRHIAAYLHERDISKFSASTGQRKTQAHKDVVREGMQGDEWLDDILCDLDYPNMVRGDNLVNRAMINGEDKNKITRKIGHALKRAGYEKFVNKERKDGRFRIGKNNVTVFSKEGVEQNMDVAMSLKEQSF